MKRFDPLDYDRFDVGNFRFAIYVILRRQLRFILEFTFHGFATLMISLRK